MLSDFRPHDEFSTDCQFGVTAAIIASALIAAGTTATVAATQSHQQSKAVDAQTTATNQAIGNLKPFQTTGTQAFQTLGSLMGLGGGGGQAQTQSALPMGNTATGSAAPAGMQQGAISNPSANHGFAAQGAGGQGLLPGGQGTFQTSQSASSYPSYAPQSSPVSMVTMKAPDGSTNSVPADQVSYWTQKGATVVHG